MKNLKSLIIFFILLLFLILGCATTKKNPPDVQARIDFANQYDNTYPIRRVSFSAQGKERKTLEISAISRAAQGDMGLTIDLLVSDKLKKEAKVLGFEEIVVEAYGDSWMDGTRKQSISLR
jgi:hypothetical protein